MKKIEYKHKIKLLWVDDFSFDEICSSLLWKSRQEFFLVDNISDDCILTLDSKFDDFLKGVPIEYLSNRADFYGKEFYIEEGVLVPRNDTEIMVSCIKESRQEFSIVDTYVDIWCWSWAMSTLWNMFLSPLNSYFFDVADIALKVSKINSEKYNLSTNIIKSDLLDYIIDNEISLWNAVFSANLPYIKSWDFENMDKEVIKYEPSLALYWWEKTGFELYEKLINQILFLKSKWKIEKGICFIEIWFDQKKIAEDFLLSKGLIFSIYKDNSWVYRCVKIYF